MKKILYKSIIIVACIILLLSTVVFATTEQTIELMPKKSALFLQWENMSAAERKNTIQPSYFDISLKDSIKRSTYNQYLLGETSEDTTFNLATDLASISPIYVKNQNKTGACWAFAFSTVIETTIANKYNKQVAEYSPMHLDYMAATKYNRLVGSGGQHWMALAYGASGLGPVYEEDLTFESVYDESIYTEDKYYLADVTNVELNQESRARIEDATVFAPIYKSYSTDSITYKDSAAWMGYNTYTSEEVNAYRQLIKKHIKENGAIMTSISTNNGNITSMYNEEKNAFFCDNTILNVDHGVTIVGWDDNFAKENFKTDNQPINDGAYIALNSWGSEFGDNGYFYISYDDAFVETALCGIKEIKEKESEEQKFYDNIYEYDQLGANSAFIAINDEGTQYLQSAYAANVFEREQTTQSEYLSEIGIFLYSAQGVEIYVNSNDDNLENCTLVGTYTGSNALDAGYHTLELAAPIKLTGDKFAIKVKYINSEKVLIPLEKNYYASGDVSQADDCYATATAEEGESFVSFDGTTWSDLDNYSKTYYEGTSNETTLVAKDTNACIKAFTTYSEGEEPETVTVTGVTLDKETVTIKEGETASLVATVLPEDATNQNITWTSDNEEVATVENGVITGVAEGTATITVTTVDGNFTDICEVTVEKVEIEPEPEPETVQVTGVTLDKETVTVKEGETATLVATVLPENATNKNITWTSDNEEIATIANGVITGVAEGTATITVTTEEGNYTAECEVIVEKIENAPDTEPETVAVTGVTLDQETVTVKEGETATLVATVLPADATNKNITWTSLDEEIATVENGVITGVAEGTTTITVTTEEGNFTAECEVTVEKEEVIPETVAVTGVTLNKETVTIKEGKTTTLVATVLPENATNKNITWASSNGDIATVESGVITGVAEGTATITVTTIDGNFTAECEVTVEKEKLVIDVSGVELDKTSVNMQVGEKINLVATIQPTNATIKDVIWTSSNEEVVKIDENGIIEALKEGTATITVTTKDGDFSASCEIKVSAKINTDDDIYTEDEEEPGDKEEPGDSTTTDKDIPNAGKQTIMMFVVIGILATIVIYKKNKSFEDIK